MGQPTVAASAAPKGKSELDVFRCSTCAAPLALADGDAVTCSSCGAQVAIPEAYRELHRARLADVALRSEAARVLRRLDRPPSLAVKVLACALDQPMGVFLLLYGIPVTLIAIGWALRATSWLAPHVGAKSADDVPFGYMLVIVVGGLFLMAFVPRVFGIYANRRAADRGRLLGALCAHPPTVPGGPATCRACGAPLAVAPDELVATCSYCRAENAVRIETPLVQATSAHVAHLGNTIVEVAASDRAQRRATRRQLIRELGRYLLRTVLLGAGFMLGAQETPDHKTTALGIVGICTTVVLFVYFVIRGPGDDGAKERRAGNDLPKWVGIVAPLVASFLLFRFFAVFGML